MAVFEQDRRKKVLQEGKSPKGYVRILLVSFSVILVVYEALFYWFIRSILKTLEFGLNNSYVIGLGLAMMSIIFVLVAIIALINIIYIHKFFGPLNRLTKELKSMEKSGKYHPLEIRKTDDLFDIASEINKLIGKIKS